MKKIIYAILACLIVSSCAKTNKSYYVLNYNKPAKNWKESLPIGNGRLGTMVTGNVNSDTLVINEETIWSGGPFDYINPNAKSHFKEVQKLILDGKYEEAIAVGDKYMIGEPRNLQRFQPLGSIIIDENNKGEIKNYTRSLDIDKAIVNISYQKNGDEYTREYFASYVDDIIAIRFTTTAKEGLNMLISQCSELENEICFKENVLQLRGSGSVKNSIPAAIKFNSSIQVVKGNSKTKIDYDGIHVSGAKELVLYYTAESNFVNYNDVSGNQDLLCENILSKASEKEYYSVKDAHIKDYTSLFDRMKLNLGSVEIPLVTTDSLINYVRNGGTSSYLDELFYQMARYLTISSSRKGSQPMNLQGLWNDKMEAAWDCKWTLNINLPMNYWMVEAANLAECHLPLIELTKDLHKTGKKVAAQHYGSRGFVAHHNTDIWRAAAPVDGAKWGLWTFGGAWLTRHIWEHYQYSLDTDFLKTNYSSMKDAALFFFDFLTEGNDEYLVTVPSVSFEQNGQFPNGETFRLCEGPTMDNQILRDLFNNCIEAAKIVGDDSSYIDSLNYFKSKLRPTTIDKERQDIMEWAWDAYPDKVSGQIAPLWGVNPGTEINPIEDPIMAEAAVKTIRLRDPHVASYETSGSWVSGTRANFWARLHKADDAYAVYKKQIEDNIFTNMLTSFYPEKYFMIDGNMGVAAAFNEMLVQSHRKDEKGRYIFDIFPALPDEWSSGKVENIRLRGGFELSMEWEDKEVKKFILSSDKGGDCVVNYNGNLLNLELRAGESKGICNTN